MPSHGSQCVGRFGFAPVAVPDRRVGNHEDEAKGDEAEAKGTKVAKQFGEEREVDAAAVVPSTCIRFYSPETPIKLQKYPKIRGQLKMRAPWL